MNRLRRCLYLALVLFALAGCVAPAPPASTPAPNPSPTLLQPTQTATPTPTATATPAPSATPTLALILPPAARFLPDVAALADTESVGSEYIPVENVVFQNLSILTRLPVPTESIGAASFAFNGFRNIAAIPQNNMYFSQVFLVIVAPDEATARMFFQFSQAAETRSQAFLVIMPVLVHPPATAFETIPLDGSPCDEAALSAVRFDVFANYRLGTPMPTTDPRIKESYPGLSIDNIADFPPEIDLYAACRARNALVLYWGSAPDNYDGKNAAIPPEAIAAQVEERLALVVERMK